jgi:hypothetical protein
MRIKFGSLLTGAAGKIGGQVVQGSPTGSVLRSHSTKKTRNSLSQLTQRYSFYKSVSFWRMLTEIQRFEWSFHPHRYTSGFHYFSAINIPRISSGQPILTTPNGIFSVFDNFNSYAPGSLGGQGNWIASRNDLIVVPILGNNVVSPFVNDDSMVRRSEVFSNDQSAEVTLSSISLGSYNGVCVRCQGMAGTFKSYEYYAGAEGRWLESYSPGFTTIAFSFIGAVASDHLRLEISGTTLKCYFNNALDTQLTGGTGVFVDSSIPSGGSPGLYGFGTAGSVDNFTGSDL